MNDQQEEKFQAQGTSQPRRLETNPLHSEALHRKAKLGAVVLVIRLVVLQLVVLGGDISLRRELSPADFGLFAIVQFALRFFTFFGDAGLG